MMKRILVVIFAAGWTSIAMSTPAAIAAEAKDKSWPCIQRKVPEISIGMVWSGPEFKVDDQAWKRTEGVAELVKVTTSRRNSIEDAKTAIDKFLNAFKGDTKSTLTQVFAGLFQTINGERREIITGIERYARQQLALAKKIKTLTKELYGLTASGAEPTPEQSKRIDEINEKFNWDTRIFDERQQSLTYVCETPVLLEQRLFALGRHIVQHLEK